MKRFTLGGIEYILARQQPGRDVECVEVSTGRIRWIPVELVPQPTNFEKYLVPGMLPFESRDPSFVMKLREERKLLLVTAKRTRQPKDPNAPKAPRSPRGSKKLSDAINSFVPKELQATFAMALAMKKGKK